MILLPLSMRLRTRFILVIAQSVLAGLLGPASRCVALDKSAARTIQSNLDQGLANDAIQRLTEALSKDPGDAQAHNFLCRVYFEEQRLDNASHECEQAVRLSSDNSNYHLWLGRIYGEKAGHAGYFEAYGLSKKIRNEFEAAVKLDPRNVDALVDLAQFYTEAPSIVGGGTDKAVAIADKLAAGLDTSRGHEMRARIAAQQKNFERAEAEFKAAIAATKSPALAWTALASFYRKQQRVDDMMHAIREAASTDHERGVALVYAASQLVRSNREPKLAIHLLQEYLASPNKSEQAPAFQVRAHLGQLLLQEGDAPGALREFDAAKAMASDYKVPTRPANKGG
jgi:Tfp pilus assembly protein PilF